MSGPDLSGYVEVNERIEAFYKKYPEGSLQSSYQYLADGSLVVVEARAYRTPDDERPAIGLASEPIPGRTPYTKDSELMNAETSAWGRAIAAFGFEVKRGITSANEVRSRKSSEAEAPKVQATRRDGQSDGQSSQATPAQRRKIHGCASALGLSEQQLRAWIEWNAGTPHTDRIEKKRASDLIDLLEGYEDAGAALAEFNAALDAEDLKAQSIAAKYMSAEPARA